MDLKDDEVHQTHKVKGSGILGKGEMQFQAVLAGDVSQTFGAFSVGRVLLRDDSSLSHNSRILAIY